jgi:catechol 2,3-dioxygenase-like lactoylglutathione lyase family enzyme
MRPMQIIRIDHVSLDVQDRPASLAWHQTVLGFDPHSRHSQPDEPIFLDSIYFSDLDGATLEVMVPRP